MSFATKEDQILEAAIKTARGSDTVLVASVGNRPPDQTVQYPAAYEGVIAVGGMDREGRHTVFSVTGPRVDIVAPATDIMSTELRSGYDAASGTSYSTAIVAGAAALVRAKFPHLTAKQVTHRLPATTTPSPPPYVSPPVKDNSRGPLLAIIVIGGGVLLAGIGAWVIIGRRS